MVQFHKYYLEICGLARGPDCSICLNFIKLLSCQVCHYFYDSWKQPLNVLPCRISVLICFAVFRVPFLFRRTSRCLMCVWLLQVWTPVLPVMKTRRMSCSLPEGTAMLPGHDCCPAPPDSWSEMGKQYIFFQIYNKLK